MRFADPQTLLRVKRKVVSECFSAWTFDIDDALAEQADMIWTIASLEADDIDFSPQGIPLGAFDAWCARLSKWVPMREVEILLPDRIRMARIGGRPPSSTAGGLGHSSATGNCCLCDKGVIPDSSSSRALMRTAARTSAGMTSASRA